MSSTFCCTYAALKASLWSLFAPGSGLELKTLEGNPHTASPLVQFKQQDASNPKPMLKCMFCPVLCNRLLTLWWCFGSCKLGLNMVCLVLIWSWSGSCLGLVPTLVKVSVSLVWCHKGHIYSRTKPRQSVFSQCGEITGLICRSLGFCLSIIYGVSLHHWSLGWKTKIWKCVEHRSLKSAAGVS